jgi:hypothetical protein
MHYTRQRRHLQQKENSLHAHIECPHTTMCPPPYYCMRPQCLHTSSPHTHNHSIDHTITCVYTLLHVSAVSSYSYSYSSSTTIYVFSYLCPHTHGHTPHTTAIVLLAHTTACICPHTTIYVSSYYYILVLILLYVSSYYYICVLISYYYRCVLSSHSYSLSQTLSLPVC